MKLAYSLAEAELATGLGRTSIREAIRENKLIPSYVNSKPIILATELQRWLESLPTERP
jgi:hypothetical protein